MSDKIQKDLDEIFSLGIVIAGHNLMIHEMNLERHPNGSLKRVSIHYEDDIAKSERIKKK